MSRLQSIRTDRWRIQCRRGGSVFREASGPGLAEAGRLLFGELADSADAGVEVELQERPAGRQRYVRVLLARDGKIVPPDGRKAEGRWAVYLPVTTVWTAVQRELVRW